MDVPKQSSSVQKTSASPVKPKPLSTTVTKLVEAHAQFFLWDVDAEGFVSAHDGILTAKIVERTPDDYDYWLTATTEEEDLILHKIASDMNPRWSPKTHSLTWNYLIEGTYTSWASQFTSPEAYESFKTVFAQASWETLHRSPFLKIKVS